MRAGPLPLDDQLTCLRQALSQNQTLGEVLARAAAMNLPGWYLVAGCLYQTVWNVISGQPPEPGILDYDLVYFDASDLSWKAEDRVIRAGNQIFAGLAAPVQIRNQARVHLWYGEKFGVACPPHASSEAAIDTYEATVASLGVHLESGERWRVYAPYGLSDVFNLVARPNPVLATRDVYEAKTARWQAQWPGLTVLPWRVLAATWVEAAVMTTNDERSPRRRGWWRQAGAWAGAVGVYAAAQGLSAWVAEREAGRGTRPQYSQFDRPAFAPPGAVFPIAWSALNLTTASSAWLVWRAPDPARPAWSRAKALAWWGAAVLIRSGYVPLAFGRRRLWAATADAALLTAVMTRYAFAARRVDRTAALLTVPEVGWTVFATALSAAVAAKNPALAEPCERPRSGDDPQPGPSGCGAGTHALTTGQPFCAVVNTHRAMANTANAVGRKIQPQARPFDTIRSVRTNSHITVSSRMTRTVILTGLLYSQDRMVARWMRGRVCRTARVGAVVVASARGGMTFCEVCAYIGFLLLLSAPGQSGAISK